MSSSDVQRAAQLHDKAENLSFDEQWEDCIRVALAAVDLFRKISGDAGRYGLVDSLVLLADAYNQKAVCEKRKPEEALSLIKEELEKFRADGNQRGEASMLLALADVNHDKRGTKKRKEALETCRDALDLFREVGDTKLEACTLLVMAKAHYKDLMLEAMMQDCQDALDIFERLGLKLWIAKAYHELGNCLSCSRRIDAATDAGTKAHRIIQELGLRRLEAINLHVMATWQLNCNWPKKALPLAEQALQIFREVGPAGLPGGEKYRREAITVRLVIEIHIALKSLKSGMKVAKAALARFEAKESAVGQGLVQESTARLYIMMDKPEKAINVVDEARSFADSVGDKKWSARLMSGVANAHAKSRDFQEVAHALDRGVCLAEEAGDSQEMLRAQNVLFDVLLLKRKDVKGASRVAAEARATAVQTGNKRGEGHACLRQAMIYSVTNENDKAVEMAKQAQMCFQESYVPKGEEQCLQFIAECLARDGDFDGALEAAEERLKIARELNDVALEASCLIQVSTLHARDENAPEAEKLLKEAQQLGKIARNSKVQIDALSALSHVYIQQAQQFGSFQDEDSKPLIQKAVRVTAEALQVAGKAQNRGLRAFALFRHAEAKSHAGRLREALRDLDEAIGVYESIDAMQAVGRCVLLRANIRSAMGEKEKSEADIERAASCAKMVGDGNLMQDVETLRKLIAERDKQEEQKAAAAQAQPVAARASQEEVGGAAAPTPQEVADSVVVEPTKKGLEPEFIRERLKHFVKEAIAEDDDIEMDSAFMDAGMDSLSSVALMTMISKEFQMALSPSLVFDFPTLRALEGHLVEESLSM
eukprot:TRINITY_DN5231_c1_g1_i1.p1 TRINITY_DN5231_c1_g1~~TRINITY_DN5231_c1_g1_i1.p1  ORF type:complete len:823 (+),score=204.10 TRINITY_DN5231_c1_g1_i1:87-2555(+)